MKALVRICCITTAWTGLLGSIAWATTWNVPGDSDSIQGGIGLAASGDTVLVAPGLYEESITFLGKDITVASFFLLSEDPTDIAGTIIDPGSGSCAVFEGGETRQAVLKGFTLTGGSGEWFAYDQAGGGAHIRQSSPTLEDLVITDCTGWGAGIFVVSGAPRFERLNIHHNVSRSVMPDGGGIALEYAEGVEILDCQINENQADGLGGGVSFWLSDAAILDCEFTGNQANSGGALFVSSLCNAMLRNNVIAGNRARFGGGIYLQGQAEVDLKSDCITGNYAQRGGGIYVSGGPGTINFNQVSRCSLHGNRGMWGRDIQWNDGELHTVVVDTFSVEQPSELLVYPPDNIVIDAQNYRWPQVDVDLYVAPGGDDESGGTTPDTPLRTIQMALVLLAPPESEARTIYLAPGTYSPSATGEIYPLALVDRIMLSGAGREVTILDAEGSAGCLVFGTYFAAGIDLGVHDLTVAGIGIGASIECKNASVSLERLVVRNNQGGGGGGFFVGTSGIGCHASTVSVFDVAVIDNENSHGGRYAGIGVTCANGSRVLLERVLVANNVATSMDMAAIKVGSGSTLTAFNCTFTGTTGGSNLAGIRIADGSRCNLVNTIVWANQGPEIGFLFTSGGGDSLMVAYCDIEGGETGIDYDVPGYVDWREGNIDFDPLFTDPITGDFSLQADSQCVDAGTAFYAWGDPYHVLDLSPEDYYGVSPDIGAVEFVPATTVPGHLTLEFPRLGTPHPNPANPHVKVPFRLPYQCDIEIAVYDISGKHIAVVAKGVYAAGEHSVVWRGIDSVGRSAPSGTFFVQLEARSGVQTRKISLVR